MVTIALQEIAGGCTSEPWHRTSSATNTTTNSRIRSRRSSRRRRTGCIQVAACMARQQRNGLHRGFVQIHVVPSGKLAAPCPLHARRLGDEAEQQVPGWRGGAVVLRPAVEQAVLVGQRAVAVFPVLVREDFEDRAALGHEHQEHGLEAVRR